MSHSQSGPPPSLSSASQKRVSMGAPSAAPKEPRATPEAKREEFRRYLERAGVLDALTRALIGLYEEPDKPPSPMEYFLDHLTGGVPAKQELDSLHAEFTQLESRATELEQENERLRVELERRDTDADERERIAALAPPPAPVASSAEEETVEEAPTTPGPGSDHESGASAVADLPASARASKAPSVKPSVARLASKAKPKASKIKP